jgi:hypothetical protein
LAITAWLRQRDLPHAHEQLAAIAATNPDAARYLDCAPHARRFTDDGITRLQRLLACLQGVL